MTNYFCYPNTQTQELETVKEKWYFSCMCAHSSWSLIFNSYISEVNCILPTQFSAGFCIIPSLSSPSYAALLHMAKQITTFQRAPHSNGFHVPVPLLKPCSATAEEAKATQKYLGELPKLTAPWKYRLIIHPEEVMKNKTAPKLLSKLSTAFPLSITELNTMT